MQVSVENTGGLERRVTVQVPGTEIQEKINEKLRELSKQVRIKGFRPGRVPLSVVKQRYGKQVRQDIVNETLQQTLQQAIQDEELRPAGMPRLEQAPEDNEAGDLEYQAVIEVYPEIDKLDVSKIEIEQPATEVTDGDIDNMMNTLREQRIAWEPVERAAKEGDRVVIDYVAETKEGRVPEEGKQRLPFIMGKSGFDKLEEAVAKIEPGKSKDVKLTFPEVFGDQAVAGKKAKVALEVNAVEEGKLPEIDEEFIQSFGIEEGDMESFREEIRGNLERELTSATGSVLKIQLVKALKEAVPDLEVPQAIVRDEATNMVSQMLQGQQLEPEQMEPLVEQFMERAEDRVRAGLLMGELANQNDLRVDATKVRIAIDTVASTYEQPEEVVQLYYSNQQLLQQVESSVLEEQVVDWALENAKVTSRDMSFQEVISAASNQAAAG